MTPKERAMEYLSDKFREAWENDKDMNEVFEKAIDIAIAEQDKILAKTYAEVLNTTSKTKDECENARWDFLEDWLDNAPPTYKFTKKDIFAIIKEARKR